MSDSVMNVDQWVSSAAAELGRESKVYWSTAEEKAPLKVSLFIHFSRTSQPPRFTPRRKGMVVLAGVEGVGVGIEVVEVGGRVLVVGMRLLLAGTTTDEVLSVLEETAAIVV